MSRQRVRRTVAWIGVVVCVILTVALFFSSQRGLIWDSGDLRHEISLMLGAVHFGWRPEGWSIERERHPLQAGWSIGIYGSPGPSVSQMTWWMRHGNTKSWVWIAIPVWIPLATVAIPTGWFFYRDRRPAPGACRCGYDLTGNTSGRCPECGRALGAKSR